MRLDDTIRLAPEVTLSEVLEAREARVRRQRAMLAECGFPLVSLTLNIPGSRKAHPLAAEAFRMAREALFSQLKRAGMPVGNVDERADKTGFEGLYAVDCAAAAIKAIAVAIEESHPIGRLFDIDVVDCDGAALRGAGSGRSERACLICGGPVWECARNRSHSAEQLSLRAAGLIQDYLDSAYADRVACLATRALACELAVTPKPGLVDRANNGAHDDMDFFTFLAGATALTPFFRDMVLAGMAHDGEAETMLAALRLPGQWAEERMFAATGGVNTHKGLLFSLGIFCSGIGHIRARGWELSEALLLGVCSRIAAGTPTELDRPVANGEGETHGRRVHAKFGLTGVRGEAAAGYPGVRDHGYPVLRRLIGEGHSLNNAGVAALLHLMAHVHDTNIAARSDLATLLRIQEEIRAFLDTNPDPERMLDYARRLDGRFIREHLSPGGSADLLALSIFLYFIFSGNESGHSLENLRTK